MNTPVVALLEALLRRALPALFDYQVHGLEHVPRGPAIIASNHLGVLDPPATLLALRDLTPPRHAHFLAKTSLYEVRFAGIPWLAYLLDQVDFIRLNPNEADLTAFKAALRRLGEGRLIGIYPEGGITLVHEPRPALPGLAMLAQQAQVPVVPLGITGTRPLGWRAPDGRPVFNQMRLRFGPPIAPPPRGRMNDQQRRGYAQSVLDTCYRLTAQSLESDPPFPPPGAVASRQAGTGAQGVNSGSHD